MIDFHGKEKLQMILVVKSGMSETWFFVELKGFQNGLKQIEIRPVQWVISISVCATPFNRCQLFI